MTAILLLQLADNLRSLRFLVSLAALLLFFVANGVVYGYKLERQAAETEGLQAAGEARYQVDTLADAVDHWYRTELDPAGTEFIADGGFSWTYTGIWLNPRSGETLLPVSTRTTNNWMARFEVLDWSVIARYVVSFLCVVLGYNAISGERERGTLRLVLANPLPRAHLLIGKLLAHWITVNSAAALGAGLSLVMLMLAGVVELDGATAAGAACWLAGIGVLSALFLLLAMGVSALSRTSASALVFLVTAWTVVVVVVPQTSYLIAVRTVEPLGPFWEAMNAHREQTRRSLRLDGVEPRGRQAGAVDDYALERRYARRLDAMERDLDAMRRDLNERIFRQYEVARRVNLLSPGFAFQYGIEALLGAGVLRDRAFFADAWRYRESLRQFLRAADAADPDSPQVPFLADYMSRAPVEPARIPRYRSGQVPLDRRVDAAVVPVTVLLLETALAFGFALWAVRRTDLSD